MSSKRRRACARYLWGGGAACEVTTRATAPHSWWSACALSEGTTEVRGRSPSAHDHGVTCQLRLLTPNRRLRVKRAQARLRSLSLKRTLSIRAYCARSPRCAGCGLSKTHEVCRTGERPHSFGVRPWCNVPATATNSKPAAACLAKRACARCLRDAGSARKHAARLTAPCWLWSVRAL